mmetsp:Transcript_23373/g.46680  ORF Transcript_23373/g.46680 Transcript_23373/m.46680 type:complete len:111 (-) Transcript_23373:52-384(-)
MPKHMDVDIGDGVGSSEGDSTPIQPLPVGDALMFDESAVDAPLPPPPVAEGSAERMAKRLAQRREELQTRVKQHINLYAPTPEVLSSDELQQSIDDGATGGAFSQALVGY